MPLANKNRKSSIVLFSLISITTFLMSIITTFAQAPQFSQFYNAPLYLNPGFAGLTEAGRTGINYRIQGKDLASKYVTSSLYFDYNLTDFNMSTGMLLVSDREEYSGYRALSAAVPISYLFQVTPSLAIKPAIEASYTTRRADHSGLLFGDQLDPSGNYVGESQEMLTNGLKVQFFNVAVGVVSYTDKAWAGIAIHQLIDQNTSFIEGGNSHTTKRYTLHGGIKLGSNHRYKRSKSTVFMPTFNFVHQGKFNQLDVGVYGLIDPVTFGLTYRGVPVTGKDQQALSALVGLNMYNLSFGYSFDFVLNRELETGGIHELSLSMTFDWRNPKNPPRSVKRLKCPAFLTSKP